MSSTIRFIALVLVVLFCNSPSVACTNSGLVPLGRCKLFAVQAGTGVAASGSQTTIALGSVGVAPGTAITGNLVLLNGAIEANSPAAINCAADELIAYDAAKGAHCPANQTLSNPDLGGLTLTPGVYCAGNFIISAGIVTLDGQNNSSSQWLFQAATTLQTATATSFILINGAQAENVFWQVGSSATIAYSSSFVGTILAYASISVDTDATINGRAFAQAAVTFAGGDSVTRPRAS